MLINLDSFSHYTTITQKYAAGSNAVITAGVGRGGLTGIVTNGTTFFLDDLVLYGQQLRLSAVVHGIALKLTSLSACTLFQYKEADNTVQVTVALDVTGHFKLYRGTTAGTLLATAADPLVVGTYYYVECKVSIADTGGTAVIHLWSDQSTMTVPVNFTGDTRNAGTGLISKISYGITGASPIASWSDKYTCDTTGSAFNDFQGNRHIAVVLPTNAGNYTQWLPLPALSPNVDNINVTPPSGTAYNFAPFATAYNNLPITGFAYDFVSPIPGPYYLIYTSADSPVGSLPRTGDLLLAYWQCPFGIVPTAAPAGFTLLGEVISGSGVWPTPADPAKTYPLTTRLYYKIAVLGDESPTVYTWTFTASTRVGNIVYGIYSALRMYRITNLDPVTPIDDYANAGDTYTAPAVTLESDLGVFLAFSTVAAIAANPPVQAVTWLPANFTNFDLLVGAGINEQGSAADECETQIVGRYVEAAQTSAPVVFSWSLPGLNGQQNTHALALRLNRKSTDSREVVVGYSPTPVYEKDSFGIGASAPTISAVMLNLCAKAVAAEPTVSDSAHLVGGLIRLAGTNDLSAGITPTSSFKIYQFPYEIAPDDSAWTAVKFNASDAGYQLDASAPPTYDLTVTAANPPAVAITVSPPDNNSNANGTTSFTRNYNPSTAVSLTAPGTAGGNPFAKWTKDGVDYAVTVATSLAMNANHAMRAVYTGAACTAGSVIIKLNGASLVLADGAEITSWLDQGVHGYTCTNIEYATTSGPRYDTTAVDNILYSFDTPTVYRGLRLPAPVNVDIGLPSAFTLTMVLITQLNGGGGPFQKMVNIDDNGDGLEGWEVDLVQDGTDYGLSFAVYSGANGGGQIDSAASYPVASANKLLLTIMCDGVNVRMLVNGVELVGVQWFNNNDSSTVYNPCVMSTAGIGAWSMDATFKGNIFYGQIPFFQINDTNLSDALRQAIESAQAAIYGITYTTAACSIGCV